MTSRSRINQTRIRAIEKARADYVRANDVADLAEMKASSARAAANRELWKLLRMIEPLADKALIGK